MYMLPKNLTATSSILTVGDFTVEAGANTFTSNQVSLQLNPLDNEVLVVYAANIDSRPPDLISGLKTQTNVSISTTERKDVGSIAAANVLASQTIECIYDGTAAVSYEHTAGESPASALPYIGIIATNDFFVNIEGLGNITAKSASVRLWAVRAKASASVYSALVQSELLSA